MFGSWFGNNNCYKLFKPIRYLRKCHLLDVSTKEHNHCCYIVVDNAIN